MATRKSNPLTGDPKIDFVKKSESRTQAVLDALHRLGNCGGAAYESTPEQRAKILITIRAAVDICEKELRDGRAANGATFKLDAK
jgi:hypothetical protein